LLDSTERSRISYTGTIMIGNVKKSAQHSASFTESVIQLFFGRLRVIVPHVVSPKAA
jgi:hypothetical protein